MSIFKDTHKYLYPTMIKMKITLLFWLAGYIVLYPQWGIDISRFYLRIQSLTITYLKSKLREIQSLPLMYQLVFNLVIVIMMYNNVTK